MLRFAERFEIHSKAVMYKIINTARVILEVDDIRHLRNGDIYMIAARLPYTPKKKDHWKIITVYKRVQQHHSRIVPNIRFHQVK